MAKTIPDVKVGNYIISENHPVLVIAEVGINHNGELKKAKEMVKVASECGAHVIKFQTHITDKEMIKSDITPGEISDEKLYDIIERCELTDEEEKEVKEYADECGILFLSTPFSKEAVDRLEKLNIPAYKTGSGELTNLPLIEYITNKGKPMLVSTGMSTMEEIRETVNLIKRYGTPLILMQCTSTYPTKYEDVNLGAIEKLKIEFEVNIGLSDHSIGIYTALGAIALGACIVEKHFTLDRNWPGPDQALSIEPQELRELVKGAKAIKQAMGSNKEIIEAEKPVINFARECVVAIKDIKAEDTLSIDNIWVKRPGNGEIPAKNLYKVLGKKVKVDIGYDEQLRWGYIE